MDHKKFFEHFGNHQLFPTEWGWEFTTEILYQAIKARLIEEITVREFAVVDGPLVEGRMHSVSRAFKLIDTTGDANGR